MLKILNKVYSYHSNDNIKTKYNNHYRYDYEYNNHYKINAISLFFNSIKNTLKLCRNTTRSLILILSFILPIINIFIISNLLSISPLHAGLVDIKKDWLCTDFGNRNCLFEDGYGCAIPNFNYNFGCVDKDKVVNGNKCFITKNEQGNESHDSDKSLPVIEINNKSYVLSKINSSQKMCKYDSNEMLCRNEDAQMIETSSSPEAGKIYTIGGEIKGLVTEVLNAKEVLDVSGGKCGLMKDKSSCLKICSTIREQKKVKKKVKDKYGYEQEIEEVIEEPSECEKFLEEIKLTGKDKDYEEWYECSKGSEGSSYCKGGGYSEEYFKGSDKKQYLNKSCCAENNEYVNYSGIRYYKLDKDFNVDDYVMFEGVYVKKSDLHKLNKVDVYRYLVLGRKSSDSNENSLFVQDNGSNSWWGHASAIARHYLYFSEGSPVVYDYSNSSVYKVIYTFPNKLEEFIKKYASCTERAIIDGHYKCVDPKFWALKDRRCINNQSSQQCFLKQLDTCLVNKHSKQRYCNLNSNSSCDVCIKWGIDIKELSLDGFKNASFKCMEWKNVTWSNAISQGLRNKIPSSYTDEQKIKSVSSVIGKENLSYSSNRVSWINTRDYASISLLDDKKCKYTVCYYKGESEEEKINDTKISYGVNVYYNTNWVSYNVYEYDADSAWITKTCNDQEYDACKNDDWRECPNYANEMWEDYYVFDVSGVKCGDHEYKYTSWEGQYCIRKPGCCYTQGYKCPSRSFKCNAGSESRGISWMEPEFSIREVDIEEVYDPNLIVE